MTTLTHSNEDLSVIDARAPRFNQTFVAVLSLIAVTTGAWPLLGLLALQLVVSVAFGRQYCVPCIFYFRVVQPRLGAGPLEDSRAPRFANIVGAIFLTGATVAYALGQTTIGAVLGGTVATLASLAAVTGLCVGCEAYRVIATLRGIRGGIIERVDLEALGASPAEAVVLFTHPLCSDCQTLASTLSTRATPVISIDVSRHRALAKKYGVSVVPLAYSVDAQGRVTGRVS